MILVTNRNINADASGLDVLGHRPNPQGANELRAVEVSKRGNGWEVAPIPDSIDPAAQADLGITAKDISDLGLDDQSDALPGSAYAVIKTLKRLQAKPRNKRFLLIYVHGYNNNVESVLQTATNLEKQFGVVCLPFTWPANGGGRSIGEKARGLASYLSDKQDAVQSQSALDRFLVRLSFYIDSLNESGKREIYAQAGRRFPEEPQQRNEFINTALEKLCPVRLNILFHSMGNYLWKQVVKSSIYSSNKLPLFDNVILAAADTNSEDHAAWVDDIAFRNNLYITINEDDFALYASRLKLGEKQKARLGQYRHGLNATNAKYIDFTDASYVGRAHTYFDEKPLRNAKAKAFFAAAFTSERAEDKARLKFQIDTNMYRI